MVRFFHLIGRALRFQRGLMVAALVLWLLLVFGRSLFDPAGWSWLYAGLISLLWVLACIAILFGTALWWLWVGTPAERRAAWEKRFWEFHGAEEHDPDS